MTKLIAAAAVVSFAGAASASVSPFSIDAVWSGDVGGVPASAGLSSDAPLVQDNFGGDTSPNPGLVGPFPDIVEDSYVSVGGEPEDGSDTARATTTAGFSFSANGVFGTWFADLTSTTAPLSDETGAADDIFIGRFTGGNLSGELGIGNLNEGGGALGEFILNLDGTPGAPTGASQQYFLDVRSFAGNTGQVNDVYIVAVPAPGAAGLLGLAGLAAARRRR